MRRFSAMALATCVGCGAGPRFAPLTLPLSEPMCEAAPTVIWGLGGAVRPTQWLWPDEGSRPSGDSMPRPLPVVQARLAGAYRLIEVQSEGAAWYKPVRTWRMVLVPMPSDSTAPLPAMRTEDTGTGDTRLVPTYAPPGERVLRGERHLVAEGTLDRLRPVAAPPPPEPIRGRLLPGQFVVLDMAPEDGPEAFVRRYVLWQATPEGRLTGRWYAGGMTQGVVPTAIGALAEADQGYFCAFRETS